MLLKSSLRAACGILLVPKVSYKPIGALARNPVLVRQLSTFPSQSHRNVSPITWKRTYSTENKNTKEENKTEQEQDRQQDKNTEQTQQEKPGGIFTFLAGVTVVVSGVLYGISTLEGSTGFTGSIYDFFNRNLFVHIRGLYDNASQWVDATIGPEHRLVLPPPMPEGYGPKYTLVIDLDALIDLVPAKNGVLISKRPGVDYLISNASKYYELVLYTKEMGGTNQVVIYKLDPTNYFSHHLFRESGIKEGEKFIEDFRKLNRDPSRVIFLDSTAVDQIYPHSNVIAVGKGDPKKPDTLLIDLTPILAKIASENPQDVRDKIKLLQTPELANRLRAMLGKAPLNQPPPQTSGGMFGGIFGGKK